MEEASQTVDKMCLDTGYDMGCDATGPLPSMAHNDAGPSYTFAHRDTFRSPSLVCEGTCPPRSSTTSPLPTTYTSPPPTTGTIPADVRGKDEMRFMPTPMLSPLSLCIPSSSKQRYPPLHQRLHTLRNNREGHNGHGLKHIPLTLGLDMALYFNLVQITYTSLYS